MVSDAGARARVHTFLHSGELRCEHVSLPVRHARTSLQRLMHNNGPDIVSAETCYAWRAAGAKVLVTSGQLRPALAIQVPACPSTKTAPLAARQCSTQAGSYFGGQDLLFVPRRPYARSGRTVSALVGQPSFACAQGQGAGYAAGHGGSIKQTDMTWQPCLLARHFLGLLPTQQDARHEACNQGAHGGHAPMPASLPGPLPWQPSGPRATSGRHSHHLCASTSDTLK